MNQVFCSPPDLVPVVAQRASALERVRGDANLCDCERFIISVSLSSKPAICKKHFSLPADFPVPRPSPASCKPSPPDYFCLAAWQLFPNLLFYWRWLCLSLVTSAIYLNPPVLHSNVLVPGPLTLPICYLFAVLIKLITNIQGFCAMLIHVNVSVSVVIYQQFQKRGRIGWSTHIIQQLNELRSYITWGHVESFLFFVNFGFGLTSQPTFLTIVTAQDVELCGGPLSVQIVIWGH